MKCLISITLVLLTTFVNGQIKRTQNWYFGDSAGLSFATNPPTVLSDGAMHAIEGCATISDTSGNLLFYTNGVTVWNKNHKVMDNGTGLFGHVSSTQSSLIVPWPGNDSLFYIFTTDAVGQNKGLNYSIVNLNADFGLGTVQVKNILLHSPVCEKLTATHHQNGKDIWLIAHGFGNRDFIAYLINNKGLVSCPVVSAIGSIHSSTSGANAQGMMKLSPSGKIIATTLYLNNSIEINKFNNVDGKVTNPILLSGFVLPYGLAYSNNEKFLYITSRDSNLVQINISSYSADTISFSKTSINGQVYSSNISLSLDGKIYCTNGDSNFLNTVNFPDSIGIAADFSYRSLNLLDAKSLYSLPNFISSYFYTPDLDFHFQADCDNDSIRFEAKSSYTTGTIAWEILKNASMIHSSNQASFSISLKDTGNYLVRLIMNGDTVSKTIYKEPSLNLGTDTTICNQKSIELTIPDNFRCLNWQDGSDSQIYTITQAGTYSVSGYNYAGCLLSDTVKVRFGSIQAPLIYRTGDSLYTDTGFFTYQWSFNETPIGASNATLLVKQTGDYKVQITDSLGCSSLSNLFPVNALSLRAVQYRNIQVFPNPSDTEKGIWIQSIWPIENIKMYSINGQLILDERPMTPSFQIKPAKAGIYFLCINHSYYSRIIIH